MLSPQRITSDQFSILELLVEQLPIAQEDEQKLHLKSILKSLSDKTIRLRLVKVGQYYSTIYNLISSILSLLLGFVRF